MSTRRGSSSPRRRAASPYAKGIIRSAKQNLRDLKKWDQRVLVTNQDGEETGECEWHRPAPLKNPFKLFAILNAKHWLAFICGFLGWTADAFDFHALTIQTTKVAAYYDTSITKISTAITVTLLLRSVGAAIFGLLGDRYGRKWPMVFNMMALAALQVGTIYSKTSTQFLTVRALFGLFMGGVYGNAIAMALDDCPIEAKGLLSGILQMGYSFGYVLAACCDLGFPAGNDTWKSVLWVGTTLSSSVGLFRCFLPESDLFLNARKNGTKLEQPTLKGFYKETRAMLALSWKRAIFCIYYMTLMNFYSHTSQDSYTTFVKMSKGLDEHSAARASIWMKTGACVGGVTHGYTSQWLGRRRTMMLAAFLSLCMIAPWVLVTGERSLSASGFFIQFFVQGVFGVIPIYLNELSPIKYRATFPGVTYQLGNMISSAAPVIVNRLAADFEVKNAVGEMVPGYGPVMAIMTAIIAMLLIVAQAFGPELRGRAFDQGHVAGVGAQLVGEDVEMKGNSNTNGNALERESFSLVPTRKHTGNDEEAARGRQR